MLTTILCSTVAVAIAGLLIKYFLDQNNNPEEITWLEFAIGMGVAVFVISPLVAWIGFNVARDNLVTFTEYWNGWETRVVQRDIPCTRDGPCKWEYDCDSYQCNPHDCNCTCTSRDDNGNCTSESCNTCYDTCYHDCPYVTQESSFFVDTTLGQFPISTYRMPENPNAHRWRSGTRVPDHIISRAGVGAPDFWLKAKDRINANDPGPVTVRKDYENYILASDRTILRQHSSDIERFVSGGLLPQVQSGIHSFYLADKVYFVGYRPRNPEAWQAKLRKLNAALGTDLQGDLHLVLTQHPEINQNPDAYVLALKAHWQNTVILGKNCLSKNGIVVVVGTTNGQDVSWARAFTGMPLGNEGMLTAFRNNLKGVELSPEALIGQVRGEIHTAPDKKRGVWAEKVRTVLGSGSIERILWGLENPAVKFSRISMSGTDSDDVGSGYLYLRGEIKPTRGQLITITIVEFILSLAVWFVAAVVGERKRANRHQAYQPTWH